ncbi:MAG: Ger(x)C family spore germination C-terminal domain-containing protein, partial [Methylocystaceae bacterium]
LDNSPVLIELISYSISKKVIIRGDQIVIKINIRDDCNFYEQSNYRNLLTTDLLKSVEARTATKIRNDAMAYLNRSQELGIDCVGFGVLVGQQYPKLWGQIAPKWHEIYPQVKFELDVRSKIRRTGLTIRSIELK